MFSGFEFVDCEHCIYGKQVQFPHKKKLMCKLLPLDLVHTDVCMMPQLSLGGGKYFVSFIDDAMPKAWVYPMRQKDDVF